MRAVPARLLAALTAPVLLGSALVAADEPRSPSGAAPKATPSTAATSRPGAARTTGKGPLPDPALLDGSTQPAEKKSETGMIGEFELPGDENIRSGKVGGPQLPPGAQAGSAGQQQQMAKGLPQGGGGGGQPPSGQMPSGQQGGAAGAQAGAQAAGGAQGPQNANAAGGPVGAGDAGAQPQGIQVAELGGEAGGDGNAGAAGATGEKPAPVAIGDKAMRIETSAAAQAGVVGAQQQVAGQTQQHEKGTGSGGRGASGAGGGNRAEKGRAIPAGL